MNDILAEWLTEMIQVFFVCFAVFELLKMFVFLEFKTVLFFLYYCTIQRFISNYIPQDS